MKRSHNINRNQVIAILNRFKERSAEKYNITRLGIFGSLARGTDTVKSDVDVVVELSKPEFFALIGIKQDLEEELKQHVDIVRYREKMNPFLKKRIDSEAVYV